MRPSLGCLLLVAACRIGFDELGTGGQLGNDSAVTTSDGDAGELGPFSPPMQQTALSTARADQGPSLTADLLEIYFFSNRNCPSCYDVFVATRSTVTDAWGPATELVALSNAAPDMAPEISADGLTLWYASERETPPGGSDIWITTRATRTSAWSAPTREPNLSTAGYDMDPSLSDDGLTMMLTSDGNGGVAGGVLVSTRATLTSPWTTPIPISELDSGALEAAGSLRGGGHVLYFGRQSATDEFDILTATRDSPATAFAAKGVVANINSAQLDFDVWVSADQRSLFFASDRTGDMEIYEARR